MKQANSIHTLFLDIGGVLLTDGWNTKSRKLAAKTFKLDHADMEQRHHLTFDTFEMGELSLQEYLSRVVFYEQRPFTRQQFWDFMCAQSQPYPQMLELARQLKARYKLKIVVVSNEGRELNAYRTKKYHLGEFVDLFVSSCFVHIRKPDKKIFQLALDIAQAQARQVVYIENTAMFVQVAQGMGIRGIRHTQYAATCNELATFGLPLDGGAPH